MAQHRTSPPIVTPKPYIRQPASVHRSPLPSIEYRHSYRERRETDSDSDDDDDSDESSFVETDSDGGLTRFTYESSYGEMEENRDEFNDIMVS